MAVVSLQSLYFSFIMIKVERCRQACGSCSTTLAGSGHFSHPGDVRLHRLHGHTGVRVVGSSVSHPVRQPCMFPCIQQLPQSQHHFTSFER